MSKEETTTFQMPPTGARFAQSEAFTRGLMGPYGSGKSSVCCIEIMRRAMEMPPGRDGKRKSRWVAIRNTAGQLLDTTLKTWLEWFPEEHYGKFNKNDMCHYVRIKNQDGEIIELDVMFRALDKPQDAAKLKSLEVTGAWLNEVVELPVDVLQTVETRVGRYPAKRQVKEYWNGVIMDTNPCDTDHWYYKLAEEFVPNIRKVNNKHYATWEDVCKDIERYSDGVLTFDDCKDEDEYKADARIALRKYSFYRQPSGLSPEAENVDNLRPGYYKNLRVGRSTEWIKVFIQGEYGFVSDGKAVYPEYRDSTHFNPNLHGPDEDNKVIIRGWDGGRTPACAFMQIDPEGRLLVFDEETTVDNGIAEFADIVNKKCAAKYPGYKFWDYGDPSMFHKGQLDNRVPRIILKAKGIELQGGIQSPNLRKAAVRKLLIGTSDGLPTFQIGPNAIVLRKGLMGGYCFKRVQGTGERYHDAPSKNKYSHVVEALEYPCTKMFGRSVIEEEFDYGEANKEFNPFGHDDDDRPPTGCNPVTGY